MQVILRAEVRGLGTAGQAVEVAPGYARNYLFPRGLAEPATPANIARWQQEQRQAAQRAARELAQARAQAQSLAGARVRVGAHAGEQGRLFGSVTAADIAAAVGQQYGITVDRRRVHLEEPLKALGEYTVPIRLHPEVEAEVVVVVEPA